MNTAERNLAERGIAQLLAIKDSDIRLSILRQGFSAVDKGVHMGGAFSATVPMVSLFYGGFMHYDVQNPTRVGQDMFVLSKGHAVATMASIYADLGYFSASILENSRSVESILNGHPGPLLPGVHIATGPLAQGLAAAQGLAIAGKRAPAFDVYCVTGDGELQEGVAWEAIMYAPQARLENLCVLVDKNEGQLDNSAQLIFSMDNLPGEIESFGWRVFSVDGTSYSAVVGALRRFSEEPRDGRPTAIVCNTKKGFGAFSAALNNHKVTIGEQLFTVETEQQMRLRENRVADFIAFMARLTANGTSAVVAELTHRAKEMGLDVRAEGVAARAPLVRTGTVPQRDKAISYNPADLPSYKAGADVSASDVISACMKVFARDGRVVSVDADLGSTSGLEGGVSAVDQQRGINVGIAESNMMCVGEAFAALGYNAWVSTFCPFFDWKVLRRIAVGYQERLESMANPEGWLSAGHGLDLTFLATAPNFETKTNGATHMGNDDTVVFSGIAGLRIIDVSCPNQLVGVIRWVMDGNRGLNYIRIMRSPSGVLYEPDQPFEYGKVYTLTGDINSDVYLVSSGRGVHEALAAAGILDNAGISVEVTDMPSLDTAFFRERLAGNGTLVVAEQNNGYLWNELSRLVLREGLSFDPDRLLAINAADTDGAYRFVHSATYSQLIGQFGLDAQGIAGKILAR